MSVIDDYLANVPEPQKSTLEHVRTVIKDVIPDSEEVIGYAIPSFKVNGKYVVHFAAFKDHLSIFPSGIADQFKDELAGFKVSKGTVQFTPDNPLPDDVIRKIVQTSLDRLSD